nr:hypothetical protein [uncultured Oscillibacter sp.]
MEIRFALCLAIKDIEEYWEHLKTGKGNDFLPISVSFKSFLSEEKMKSFYGVLASTSLSKWAKSPSKNESSEIVLATDLSYLLPDKDSIRKILPVLIWSYATKYKETDEPIYQELTSLTPSRFKKVSRRFIPDPWYHNKAKQTSPTRITPQHTHVLNKYQSVEFFLYLLDNLSHICDPYLSVLLFDYHTHYLKLYFLLSDYKELELGKSVIPENFRNPQFMTSLKNICERYQEDKTQHLEWFCDIMKVYLWSYHQKPDALDSNWPYSLEKLFEHNIRKVIDGYKFLSYMEKFDPENLASVPPKFSDEDSTAFDESSEEFDALFRFMQSDDTTSEDINALRSFLGVHPVADIGDITDSDIQEIRNYMDSHLFS